MKEEPILSFEERLDQVNEQIKLIQRKGGLTFGTDAYLLAAYIKSSPREDAVELGAGTGIISFLLATKNKVRHVTAVEIQPIFSDLIERNILLNGLSAKVSSLCKDVRELSSKDVEGEVKLVFSNPPYMKADSGKRNEKDEKFIARHEVYGEIFDFCQAAERLLAWGGKFVTVYRPDRIADLFSALRACNLEPKRLTVVYPDSKSEPCMVLCESVKGAKASLSFEPPLLLYEDEKDGSSRIRTKRTESIYETCSFFENREK